MNRHVTAVIVAAILAAAILGAALLLRPSHPMTAEQACVAKGGTWKVLPSPITPQDMYTQQVLGTTQCIGGKS